jgi:hypothetical protein
MAPNIVIDFLKIQPQLVNFNTTTHELAKGSFTNGDNFVVNLATTDSAKPLVANKWCHFVMFMCGLGIVSFILRLTHEALRVSKSGKRPEVAVKFERIILHSYYHFMNSGFLCAQKSFS